MAPVLRFGHPRLHFRSVDSTNQLARELASGGAPDGTLITARQQTAGRGRQGRSWAGPPGSALLCSLIVRDPPRLLPLAAGVAVAEVAGPQARLKWPNDVLIDGRKVAGILVEGRPQEGWAVVGVGLNVAVSVEELPPELRDRAGSLRLGAEAIEPTLERLLERLDRWIAASAGEVLAAVRERDALLGRRVRWGTGEGQAAGIDGEGRLIVSTPEGQVGLEAGEVHLVST